MKADIREWMGQTYLEWNEYGMYGQTKLFGYEIKIDAYR